MIMNDTMESALPKPESMRDISFDSSISTPEAEAEAEALGQDVAQVHKRKGGRKPVCMTCFTYISRVFYINCGASLY